MAGFLEKKESKIHGLGIFTTKKIKKNKVFYTVPTDCINHEAIHRWAFIGNGIWVCDNKVLNWINHSCNANTELNIKNDPPSLVATRDINANEEITCDYNETEKGGEKAVCTCKSENCRGFFLRLV